MENVDLQDLLRRMAQLEAEVESLKPVEFRLPPDTIVGPEYVAKRRKVSVAAVRHGRNGTDKIPRISTRPLRFYAGDADRVCSNLEKSTKEIAAEESSRANVRRRSIIKK